MRQGYCTLEEQERGEEFDRTERISPGSFMVPEYLNVSRRLDEGRLSFEAFHLFERATTAEPLDPDAVITLCRKALELSPEFPSARPVLGRTCSRKRDYEKVIELNGSPIATRSAMAQLATSSSVH